MSKAIDDMLEERWEKGKKDQLKQKIEKIHLPKTQNKGTYNLIKAIDDMLKDSREKGRNDCLKLRIKKKLAKGKSVEVIADELDEEQEVIEKLIAEMKAE